MRELGATLGISDDAAKMRVNRALGRLRDKLAARGVASDSAIALGAALSQHAVEAARPHNSSSPSPPPTSPRRLAWAWDCMVRFAPADLKPESRRPEPL